ncbi:DUF2889 domain-containing protein [Alcaligenaceae bacterium]|nr:DUF2889 domain-containing protein [Alcaligenaceae bacterium]
MPLPPPELPREPLHTRSIRVNTYVREDGQWDLEAELIDFKAYDFPIMGGTATRYAGDPIHHMLMRVTINDQFTITGAVAGYDAAPYGENCTAIAPDYQDMVGMNLLRNFRQVVKDRYGRTAGCSHMTELSYLLPTVAIQTMANQRRKEREAASVGDKTRRPFQLEGCHALRLDGPVVQEIYPTWYAAPKAKHE